VVPELPRQPGPADRDRDDREPVPGEVLGSRRDDEPLLGGAPRRLMLRLFVLAAVVGVLVPGVLWLVADGPAWALLRVGAGAGVLVLTVGWRVLRVLHRAGRLP
jgi:hypothetical protein